MYSLRQVYKKPAYVFLSLAIFLLTVAFILLAPNWSLITQTTASEGLLFGAHLSLSLLWSIHTNLTVFGALSAIAISFLFGINVSLLVYKLRELHKVAGNSAATSGVGLFAGILGIGCASCGTVLFSAFIPLIGAGGLLGLLPFGGQELQFIAIGLLAFSITRLLKDIASPAVCAVPDIIT